MTRTQKLLDILLKVGALKHGEFPSDRVTLNPEGSRLLSLAFLYSIRDVDADIKAKAAAGSTPGAKDIAKNVGIKAVGGPTPDAEHLVRAICLLGNIPAFTVFEGRIEGRLEKGTSVAIVKNTCGTGESLLKAIADVEDLGHKVVLVIVLVDLCKGGREKLGEAGHDLVSIFEVTPEGEIVPTEQEAR